MKILLIAGGSVGGLAIVCCGGVGWLYWSLTAPTTFPDETESYTQARNGFQTQLVRQGPAPQSWEPVVPPAGVNELTYPSGGLELKAWVNAPMPDKQPMPAVLFLHGGFAFGADDWDQAVSFHNAGFVVMMPRVRGENGLPGSYSMFYNEVDDVIAAANVLADLPYVNGKRIYVCGHSAGGTLALLAAMTSDRFQKAAAFSGSPDQVAFSRFQDELVPFAKMDKREFQMRSPLAFPRSFKCPVRIFYGSEEMFFAASSKKTALKAKAGQIDVEAISVPGDHFTSVAPAINLCITFFQQQ